MVPSHTTDAVILNVVADGIAADGGRPPGTRRTRIDWKGPPHIYPGHPQGYATRSAVAVCSLCTQSGSDYGVCGNDRRRRHSSSAWRRHARRHARPRRCAPTWLRTHPLLLRRHRPLADLPRGRLQREDCVVTMSARVTPSMHAMAEVARQQGPRPRYSGLC